MSSGPGLLWLPQSQIASFTSFSSNLCIRKSSCSSDSISKCRPSKVGLTKLLSLNLASKNVLTTCLTSQGLSTHLPSRCNPLNMFLFLLHFSKLWKYLVFWSPSCTYLHLDLSLMIHSFCFAAFQNSSCSSFFFFISFVPSPISSSFLAIRLSLCITFLSLLSTLPNSLSFHSFIFSFNFFIFSFRTYAPHPLTSMAFHSSCTSLMKLFSLHQQLRTLKGFGPQLMEVTFRSIRQ
ncbi:hypothetical protein AAZV13_10G038900 [Glycine max]